MRTVKQFLQSVYFLSTFYKGICCGYPFELHRLDAIRMRTHNLCFYKENQKNKTPQASLHKSFADLFLSVSLVKMDTYFTTSFPSNFEKLKRAVQ